MKEGRRIRLNQLYKQEVSKMILTELKDPRIGFVTVVSCDISGDLSQVKARISVLGGDKELSLTLHGLNSSAPMMQGEIARRMRLRTTPFLSFEFDPGIQKSIRITQLLDLENKGKEMDQQIPFASQVLPNEELDDDE